MSDNLDVIEQLPLTVFSEQAYLDYAMYVILDRALPHIGDGLKPVQRRIVYAMSELGLSATAKFKKSARTIGDVLGKFHPHGDSACYEAMVLMAQPFSYRYPLVDGQGNWGSADDPKSFAAMRYTEARLAPYAAALLSELGQGTVDWVPNFDGTLQEPKVLPARLPNVLLNGTTGIAVGMATDIPPHNISECVQACILLLEKPKATLREILQIIKGPDYPTPAEIITPAEEINKIYQTGGGSIKMRAVIEEEGSELVITALPHLVSGAKVLEQIAGQMQAKKLSLVTDLRDESDHENPTRLVVVPKSNRVDKESLKAHLFASTDLEKSYRVNLNVIGLDGRPKVCGLLPLLQEWLNFRSQVVKRRLQYRLDKVTKRLHLLDGYLIAFLNIDEVIAIIREADNPKRELMRQFGLSELQADAILELKLKQLAKLEEMKIRAEQQELEAERVELEKTLGSDARLKTLIKKELKQDLKTFDSPRRSQIVVREEAKLLDQITQITREPMTAVLSAKGWIRAGKGHEIDVGQLNFKSGDEYLAHVLTASTDQVVILDSTGRTYSLYVHTFPSMRGYGDPLTTRLSPPAGAVFKTLLAGEATQNWLLYNSAGFGFYCDFENLTCKNRKGKTIMSVAEPAEILTPIALPESLEGNRLAVVTNDGRLLLFPLTELAQMNKGRGKKLIAVTSTALKSGDSIVVGACVVPTRFGVTIQIGKRKVHLSPSDLKHHVNKMGHAGHKLSRSSQKVQAIYAAKS